MRSNRPLFAMRGFRYGARFTAQVLLVSLVYELMFPLVSYGLTSGPATPDFSSFEPVATTNMVNEFTGQFVYNIPVLEVPGAGGGGYALSLSYHSGNGPESEASWVGYGWTLNPGAIMRNRRGIPDDYNGTEVSYHNDVPANWTIAATGQIGPEIASSLISVGAYTTVRYNNYKGFGITAGVGLNALRGVFSLGFNLSEGEGTFSPTVNPAAALNFLKKKKTGDGEKKEGGAQESAERPKQERQSLGKSMANSAAQYSGSLMYSGASRYISYLLTDMSAPYNVTPYRGMSIAGTVTGTVDPPPFPAGVSIGVHISFTRQKNIGSRQVKTFGYMYGGHSGDNNSDAGGAVQDYTLERAALFHKRDRYLSVPFNTPDAYFVSGEGIGGSFRMYNDKVGVRSPNYVSSDTRINFFGVDLHTGLDNGGGGEGLVSGGHTLTVQSSWSGNANGNTDEYRYAKYHDTARTIYEDMFFRFNNDMGGKVVYDNSRGSDHAVAPALNGDSPDLPGSLKEIKAGSSLPGDYRRSERSSYIGYRTNAELKHQAQFNGSGYNIRPMAYGKNEQVHQLAGRGGNANLDDQIGEISVVNESGNEYVYGLPVYNGGERSLQCGIAIGTDYYLAHKPLNTGKKIGEEYSTPYASCYLLTQITTPDYLDINQNGPDDVDFGGYTRFSYRRHHGSTDKSAYSGWYHWRIPYTGTYRQPGRHADHEDDLGSYQSGYKEVYYLDSIITKTHYAVFVTEERADGYDAAADDYAAQTASARGNKGLQRLKEIRLYAKATQGGDDRLIKTVHLEHDYSAWGNVTNNNGSSGPKGKLTLKRVWFEYNGVVNAYISPYRFEYKYPDVSYPAPYSYIRSEMNATGLLQQPNYTWAVDCWGNYQYDGENRRNKLQSWVSQQPAATWDAAAWELKRIMLPSGGEIHVQYEPHSYSYVQDRPAHAMVRLASGDNNGRKDTYALNLSDLGITTAADKQRLAAYINQHYAGRKMYFKFFYALLRSTPMTLDDCYGDYLDGYVNFIGANYHAGSGEVRIKIGGGSQNIQLPWQMCNDYVKKEIGGRLYKNACGDRSNQPSDPGGDEGRAIEALRSMATKFRRLVIQGLELHNACQVLNPDLSYLRIPVWRKQGGGIRVKRLMMYNKGVDANNPGLYGTEYVYENESDGTSYGVATNEPMENREENPLVTYLEKRSNQKWTDRMISGPDKEQFEGPLGMQAIAAASIGYSRVIKRNIHQNKMTGTGYTVVDYFTAKDYPYDGYYPHIGMRGQDVTDIQLDNDEPGFDIGLFSYTIRNATRATQGYSFVQNQMHGQLRSQATYPGSYTAAAFYDPYIRPAPLTQQVYRYYEPGERIPMYNFHSGSIYYDQPGKEMDVSIDRRSVIDESEETRLTGDITVGTAGPITIPYAFGFPISSSSYSVLNTMSLSKVIHYPAILKEVSERQDHMVRRTRNTAFDPLTARPVITQTWDSYHGLNLGDTIPHNGTYTTYNYPASSQYDAMGQKAWNEKYQCTLAPGATLFPSGSNYMLTGLNGSNLFSPGDLVALHNSSSVHMAYVTSAFSGSLQFAPAQSLGTSSLNTGTGYYEKVEILRSGRTNQLTVSSGGFTEYGSSQLANTQMDSFLCALNNFLYNGCRYGTASIDLTKYNIKFGPCNNYVDSMKLYKTPDDTLRVYFFNGYMPGPGCDNSIIGYEHLEHYDGYNNYEAIMAPNPRTGSSTGLAGFSLDGNGFLTLYPQYRTYPYYDGVALRSYCPGPNNLIAISHLFNLCYSEIYNIISANVHVFNENVPVVYDHLDINTSGWTVYENGTRGKWRKMEEYVYRNTTIRGFDIPSGERNYRAGTTLLEVTPGSWVSQPASDTIKWVRTAKANRYSSNGNATESETVDGRRTAVKYGYRNTLPYVQVQNAGYDEVIFESFENLYNNNKVEDGVSVWNGNFRDTGHTGRRGYKLEGGASPEFIINSARPNVLRFWAHVPGWDSTIARVSINGAWPGDYPSLKSKAGDWNLYEYFFSGSPSPTVLRLYGWAIIDDLLIRPVESEASCYVYDVTTSLPSAILGSDHFATFYQYNGEGKLIRKIQETERGRITVEDAHYHLPSGAK